MSMTLNKNTVPWHFGLFSPLSVPRCPFLNIVSVPTVHDERHSFPFPIGFASVKTLSQHCEREQRRTTVPSSAPRNETRCFWTFHNTWSSSGVHGDPQHLHHCYILCEFLLSSSKVFNAGFYMVPVRRLAQIHPHEGGELLHGFQAWTVQTPHLSTYQIHPL